MSRPKAKPFSEINFKELYDKVVKLTEQTLNDLDEGWNEEEEMNENEDILEDQDQLIIEASIEAIYGKEYWDYFNDKV